MGVERVGHAPVEVRRGSSSKSEETFFESGALRSPCLWPQESRGAAASTTSKPANKTTARPMNGIGEMLDVWVMHTHSAIRTLPARRARDERFILQIATRSFAWRS